MVLNMTWQPIPFTRGCYSASDTGEIRRDKAVRGNHNAFDGRTMRQTTDRYGYPQTSICLSGKQSTVTVHRLVALAFLGDPHEDKPQVNHKNGIKSDNRPENLEWCSLGYNIRHSIETGLKCNIAKGSRSGGSKLTEAQVSEIRSRSIKRGQQRLIAIEFGVSQATISHVVNRIGWKHV